MDKGVKIKIDETESRAKTVWKYIGYGALSLVLALITVIVINI